MRTAPVAATEPGIAPPRRGRVLAVLALAQLMMVLDTTIVNIALPSAQADLGFSYGSRQWIVTAYALAFAALLLLGGRLADLFGRKPAFLIGAAGFAAASALGVSPRPSRSWSPLAPCRASSPPCSPRPSSRC